MAPSRAQVSSQAVQTRARFPGRILVVDDEAVVRDLLERVLGGAGHEVEVVADGESALRKLAAAPFDLVVVDKNLPGLGGLELLRKARTAHPRLQAILDTGYPSKESEAAARDLGVHAYVTKTLGIFEIVAAADAAMAAGRGSA